MASGAGGDSPEHYGVVWCCTTERQNTHVIDMREVLYPWHPWFGRSIYAHEVIDKSGDAVFRCSLTGRPSDRLLEVPVWMFDRAACAVCRRVDMAYADSDALSALARLIRDVGRFSSDTSTSRSRAGAALDSEHEIRRLANAVQNDDNAARTVPEHLVHNCDTYPALAEPARRHAASADPVVGAPDDGSRRRGRRGERS